MCSCRRLTACPRFVTCWWPLQSAWQAAAALRGGVGGTLLFAGLGTLIDQPSVPRHQLAVVAVVVAATCVLLVNLACRLLEWTLVVAPGAHHDAAAFAGGTAR